MFIRYVPPWGMVHVQRNEMGGRRSALPLRGLPGVERTCEALNVRRDIDLGLDIGVLARDD